MIGHLHDVFLIETHSEACLPNIKVDRRQIQDVRDQFGEERDRHELELETPPENVPLLTAPRRIDRAGPDLVKEFQIWIVIGKQSREDDLRRRALRSINAYTANLGAIFGSSFEKRTLVSS